MEILESGSPYRVLEGQDICTIPELQGHGEALRTLSEFTRWLDYEDAREWLRDQKDLNVLFEGTGILAQPAGDMWTHAKCST